MIIATDERNFHHESIFFMDGKLKEEPSESLETLMKRYEKEYESCLKERKKLLEASLQNAKWQWIGATEPLIMEDSARDIARELAKLNQNIEDLKTRLDNNGATSGGEK